MTLVKHRAYRDLERWRIAANDAGQAITLAIRVMTASVEELPADGSLLPFHYRRIAEIQRLNVTRDRALEILSEAEGYFAGMAIPFYVAVLNGYFVEAARILEMDGVKLDRLSPDRLLFGKLRKKLQEKAGITWPPNDDSLMGVIQRVRNRIIHHGGEADQDLCDSWQSCSQSAKRRWKDVARRSFAPRAGEALQLGNPEVRVTLAVTTFLAKATNSELARLVSPETWATLAVSDWKAEGPRMSGDEQRDLRKLVGFSRLYYKSLALPEGTLERALRRHA